MDELLSYSHFDPTPIFPALGPQKPSMGRQEARHGGYKHGVRALIWD